MKNKFTIFCSLFVVFVSNAQVSVNLIRQNTDIKFVNGRVAIWDVLVSKSRMTFSGGVGGTLYLNGLYCNANYDFHYLDNLAEASSSENIEGSSIFKPTKSRNADLTLGYFFQHEKEGAVRVNLRQTGKTRYYTNVDALYNQIFGIQASYKSGFSHLTIPGGMKVRDYYNVDTGMFVSDGGFTTFMKYSWLSVGGSFGKTVDVEVDVEGYGNRKVQYFQRFYANAIIAVKSQLEDVYYEPPAGSAGNFVYRYVLDGTTEMSKIGFNVGFETFKMNKFGVGYGLEAGLMPGVKKGGNGYLQLKWRFVFGKLFSA